MKIGGVAIEFNKKDGLDAASIQEGPTSGVDVGPVCMVRISYKKLSEHLSSVSFLAARHHPSEPSWP